MKNAGGLIRVSTERQLEGTSPEKQLDKIHFLAQQQGYSILPSKVWQMAESGALHNRVGFSNAIDSARNGEISRLFVYSVDRLGRSLLELLLFLRQMDEIGVEVWAAEKGECLREDDFVLQILGAMASKERQEIIKRTQDGLKRAVAIGRYSGGIVAYGYQLNSDNKRLEIQKQEADVVRKIFDWCVIERLSCVQIAERLNALQIKTHYQKDNRLIHVKGKRESQHTAGIWRASRIRNMLKNTAYCGEFEWGKRSKKGKNRTRIPGFSPAIISKETFEAAGKVLQSNRLFFPENPHHEYLLRGLIRCGNCGRAYCGSSDRVAPHRTNQKSYYRCNGRTQHRKLGIPKCPSKSISAREIENIVWADIQSFCQNPEVAISQLKNLRQPFDDVRPEQVNEVKGQLLECERKKQNLLRIGAESREIDIETLDRLLVENRKQTESLQEYLNHLTEDQNKADSIELDLISIAERLKEIGARIDQATFTEKRCAVCELVKEIIVTPEELNGKSVSAINIVYRFNELPPVSRSSTPVFIQGCTGRGSWLPPTENWPGR